MKMKGIFAVCTAGVLMSVFAITASAADVPVKSSAPQYRYQSVVTAPVFNWNGFYTGGHVGYGIGSVHDNFGVGINITPQGFVGDVGATYRYDTGALLVWGINSNIAFMNVKGDQNFLGIVQFDHRFKRAIDLYGTVGTVFGSERRFLVEFGAGYYWAKSTFSVPGIFSQDIDSSGLALKASVNYALNNNWAFDLTVKHFFSDDQGIAGIPNAGSGNLTTVMLGLSYKFAGRS